MSNRITWRINLGLLGCLLLLGGRGALRGQATVSVGDTVRLDHVYPGTSLWLTQKEGIFAGRQADTVLLRSGDQTLRLRLTNLTQPRVERGREPWGPGKGIVLGLLASTLIQAVWVATDSYEKAGCQRTSFWGMQGWGNCARPRHDYHGYWFLAGALGGGTLGYVHKRPHWLKAVLP